MKKHNPSERGQAIVLIALAIVGTIGMIGLTIDGGLAYSDRRHAQNAADNAALAAGRSMIREEDWEAAALSLAASNSYDNNGTTNIVQVLNPPNELSNYEGDEDYIQVIITSHVQTTFARVVGITEMTNIVQAVARVVPTTEVNMFDGNAIVSLNPGDCKAFTFQGNAETTLTGGGVFVNSDCPTSAFFNNSNSSQMTAPSLCSVGGIDYKPGALDIPSGGIQSGDDNCEQYDYPVADYIMPLPDCGGPAVQSGSTLSPGDYSGTFPPNGVTFLEPGVYCVDGDFRLNANDVLTGSDVVIYMIDGEVRWNGGAEVNLDAPNEGPFDGLLIYLPYENDNTVIINGNAGSGLTGTILAPASDVQVNGTGESGINGQIIGYNVDISGTSDMNINYNANENYHAETPPNLQLTE
jgi:Flp pilus assembly protein TadG